MIKTPLLDLRRARVTDSTKLAPTLIADIRNDASNGLKSISNSLDTQHPSAVYNLKGCIDAYHDLHSLKQHAQDMHREAQDLQTLFQTKALPNGSDSDAFKTLFEFRELQKAAADADVKDLSVFDDDDIGEWIDELAEAREKALETTLNRFDQALPAVRKQACAELCRIEDLGEAIKHIESEGLTLEDMLPPGSVPTDLPNNIGKATFDPWSPLGAHCADRNASVLATKLKLFLDDQKASARRSKNQQNANVKAKLKDQVLDDIADLIRKGE
jgi:hypothetical protein